MEIELLGLRRLTEDEQRLVDSHAERDDEVDWDQLQLSSIPEHAELDDVDDVLPSLADMRDSDDDEVTSPRGCRDEKEQLAHSCPCP
jgi:hypothetical protein